VARYITMDLARGDHEGANRNFNTFLVIGLAMASVLLVLAVAFSFLLPFLFKIPAGMEVAARVVFLAVAFAFLISTISNTFESAIWVSNRFEIRSLIESSSLLLRVGLVVLFFYWWQPSLFLVAIAIPIPAFGALLANIAMCRKLAPSLRVRWSDFDRSRLPALWYTSRWLLIGQLGTVLFLNIDLVLANILLGPEAGGHYAPMVQWATLLRTVVESCPTTMFLANPALDRQQYADLFRLNTVQLEQLATLTPRRQLLLKRDQMSKILTLDVDEASYWLYTNTPMDHARSAPDGLPPHRTSERAPRAALV
jgi:hypothetical protein